MSSEISDPLPIAFAAVIAYTPLLVIGTALAIWWQESLPGPTESAVLLSALGLGFVAGLSVVLLTRFLTVVIPALRALEAEFRATLGPLSVARIVTLALLSGVTEEICFRGVLQPWAGYWVASLLFGALHFVPHRAFRAWPLFALISGFLFGALYEKTGSLLAPIVAHTVVNGTSLWMIMRSSARTTQRRECA